MSLSSLSTGSESTDAMNAAVLRHDELLAKNRVKIGILRAYLGEKLEGIGHGNVWIGKYFPDEVMFGDLGNLGDTQITEIHEIGDRYFQIICQKIGIK